MRIALAQILAGTEPAANLALVEDYTRRAADAGATLQLPPAAAPLLQRTVGVNAVDRTRGDALTAELKSLNDDVRSGKAMVSKKIILNALPTPLDSAMAGALCIPKKAGHQWSEEERKALYNGLRLFGTDFSIISATILKHRSRKEVFRRFQREDKLHPDLVSKSLQWHVDNKARLQKGFSRVLKALQIDVDNFNPIEFSFHALDNRNDEIKPLEFYLLNPPQ